MSGLACLARQAMLFGVAFVLAACEEEPKKAISATRERSQAVAASPSPAPTRGEVSTLSALPPAASARPRRSLCAGQMREGKALPKKSLSQATVGDAHALPSTLNGDSGSWIWVNFWAAWCAPCKEEIPRLVAWERELAQLGRRLRVAFVSVDDDERQLKQFLESQGSLRATYWLREGKERDEWMKAAALDSDPELPIHLLVDPHGKLRCKVQGAVEDADFLEILRLLDGKFSE